MSPLIRSDTGEMCLNAQPKRSHSIVPSGVA